METILDFITIHKSYFITLLIPIIISSITSLAVYWLKTRHDARKIKTDELNRDVLIYIVPLINSLSALYYRLNEIINNECLYLKHDVTEQIVNNNQFLKNKYYSTMYRFCSVLGCISILKKEITPSRFNSKFKKLDNYIDKLERVIADGSHVDMKIAYNCCTLLDSEIDSSKVSVKIENLLFKHIGSDDKSLIKKF